MPTIWPLSLIAMALPRIHPAVCLRSRADRRSRGTPRPSCVASPASSAWLSSCFSSTIIISGTHHGCIGVEQHVGQHRRGTCRESRLPVFHDQSRNAVEFPRVGAHQDQSQGPSVASQKEIVRSDVLALGFQRGASESAISRPWHSAIGPCFPVRNGKSFHSCKFSFRPERVKSSISKLNRIFRWAPVHSDFASNAIETGSKWNVAA